MTEQEPETEKTPVNLRAFKADELADALVELEAAGNEDHYYVSGLLAREAAQRLREMEDQRRRMVELEANLARHVPGLLGLEMAGEPFFVEQDDCCFVREPDHDSYILTLVQNFRIPGYVLASCQRHPEYSAVLNQAVLDTLHAIREQLQVEIGRPAEAYPLPFNHGRSEGYCSHNLDKNSPDDKEG